MPRFQFRLATVLRLREATRDERRGQLAEAYLAEQKLRTRRQAVEQELAELKQVYEAGAKLGEVNLERLLAANRFEAVLRSELHVLDEHQQALAAEIEKRRAALVAADREVRVLEKLREHKQEQHREREAQQSIKQLDEVAARQSVSQERF